MNFETKAFDELSYAETAAQHFGSPHFARRITPSDAAALLPKIAEAYDEPFGNSSAVPTYYCAKHAQEEGISVLLATTGDYSLSNEPGR